MAVLEASSQPVIISHGQLGYSDTAHPRLMNVQHAAAVAAAGGLVGAWPCGITSRSLADFGTEIIRLASRRPTSTRSSAATRWICWPACSDRRSRYIRNHWRRDSCGT
jgi:hypothetical protein